MTTTERERLAGLADDLRSRHSGHLLVLPNAWDVASAQVVEQAGFPVVATASAAVTAVLGHADGEGAPREEMFAANARIARAVSVPVTMDAEAGYEMTARDLVARLLDIGVVGCNLEDSDHVAGGLRDADRQAAWLAEVRAAADAVGVPLVVNARVDLFFPTSPVPAEERVAEAIRRGRLYREAGADCVYPIASRGSPRRSVGCDRTAVGDQPIAPGETLLGHRHPGAGVAGPPPPGCDFADWVMSDRRGVCLGLHCDHFHPYGGSGGWPRRPPTFMGFRWGGVVRQINRVVSYEVYPTLHAWRPAIPLPPDDVEHVPHVVYQLGLDIPIPHISTTGVYATGRVEALLDQMLTQDTLQAAVRASKESTAHRNVPLVPVRARVLCRSATRNGRRVQRRRARVSRGVGHDAH